MIEFFIKLFGFKNKFQSFRGGKNKKKIGDIDFGKSKEKSSIEYTSEKEKVLEMTDEEKAGVDRPVTDVEIAQLMSSLKRSPKSIMEVADKIKVDKNGVPIYVEDKPKLKLKKK